MRILYCNKYNFPFSGTEVYLFETMELMRARGHEVALFSMASARGAPTPYDAFMVKNVDFKATRTLPQRVLAGLHAVYSFEARTKMRGMVREFRPDVAHVRNIYHHLSPSILWELRARGVPVLYHMNDLKLFCPVYNMVTRGGDACSQGCAGGRFWKGVAKGCYAGGRGGAILLAFEAYFHRWIRTYERCVDLVLAPSDFVKDMLLRNGWSQKRIQVLPHFQHIPPQPVPEPAPGAPIVYFGRLSPEKGVVDLISAMQKVPDLQLIIAGEGPQKPELEAQARRLDLRNVRFCGHLSGDALERLIAESQFTIFPSRAYETLGKSILESYAQGRAVIASDLGSRRELVEEGETGLLYPVGDADQLAARIAFLRDHPELAKRMGNAGRERLRARHSQGEHLQELTRIYEQLASRDPAGLSARVGVRLVSRLRRAPTGSSSSAQERPLRVAFIGGRGVIGKYSGIETYYEQVGARLAGRGVQVTAYCRNHFTPKIDAYRGIRVRRLPTIRTKHLETLLHSFLSTLDACCGKHDVVHYHTLGPSLFSFLPRLIGKKTIVTVQGLDWQRKKWQWFARNALRLGEWCSAHLPHRTLVVSETLQKYYRSRYGNVAECVPNGTEVRKCIREGHLERLGLQPNGYVLFAGRLSPEKNCDLLIDAFRELDTPFQLVLAGGSSHTDQYAASLRSRQTDRIRFLPWLSGSELEEVLTNSALFVLPSDLEGLSLALLDAMGAGVCVLASDIPENCEALGNGGFTFRRGDRNDLKRMMAQLLADPELRKWAGARAQERVRDRYLWDGIAEQMHAIYAAMVMPSGTPRRHAVLHEH